MVTRWGAAVALAGVMLAGAVTAAGAQDRGVALDVGRIDVAEAVRPGERYSLPTVTVRNPGQVPGRYRMAVQPVAAMAAPPGAWFTFTPAQFRLGPDERQEVTITMTVPEHVAGGDYRALLSAQQTGDDAGARVGAAAAAQLLFTVEPLPPAPNASPWWWGWLLLALLLLVALVLLRGLSRRYAISIRRRP